MDQRSYNRTLGWLRRILLYGLLAFLVVLARPSELSVVIGFIPVVLGEAIRFWSAGHLLKTQELVTSGPYRYTRNPLYLGRLLIFSGLTIMANLPYYGSLIGLVVGWAIFFGYYLPRKERVEPARLRELHGEPFERYHRAVPALFPSLRPYSDASNQPWSKERMLRNREQWMVVGLLLVSAYFAWRAFGG